MLFYSCDLYSNDVVLRLTHGFPTAKSSCVSRDCGVPMLTYEYTRQLAEAQNADARKVKASIRHKRASACASEDFFAAPPFTFRRGPIRLEARHRGRPDAVLQMLNQGSWLQLGWVVVSARPGNRESMRQLITIIGHCAHNRHSAAAKSTLSGSVVVQTPSIDASRGSHGVSSRHHWLRGLVMSLERPDMRSSGFNTIKV